MNTQPIEGGCLCQAVRYCIDRDPIVVLHCHCSDCRKASGAPFLTWAVFSRGALRWAAMQPLSFEWSGRERLFCPICGTSLVMIPPESTGLVAVTAGSLDHPESITPTCHTWTEDKLPWIQLADPLPAYAEMMGG